MRFKISLLKFDSFNFQLPFPLMYVPLNKRALFRFKHMLKSDCIHCAYCGQDCSRCLHVKLTHRSTDVFPPPLMHVAYNTTISIFSFIGNDIKASRQKAPCLNQLYNNQPHNHRTPYKVDLNIHTLLH